MFHFFNEKSATKIIIAILPNQITFDTLEAARKVILQEKNHFTQNVSSKGKKQFILGIACS